MTEPTTGQWGAMFRAQQAWNAARVCEIRERRYADSELAHAAMVGSFLLGALFGNLGRYLGVLPPR